MGRLNPELGCQIGGTESFFQNRPILPVENVVSLIPAIGCVSHAIRGTVRDTGRKSFFSKTPIFAQIVAVTLIRTIG